MSGLASLLGVVGIGAGGYAWRALRRVRREKLSIYEYGIQRVVESQQRLRDQVPPDDVVTLECIIGPNLRADVGITHTTAHLVWMDLWMTLIKRTAEETICTLTSDGVVNLPKHAHMRIELLQVISGAIHQTGRNGEIIRTFRALEVWEVGKEEIHECIFVDAACAVTYRPALPDATQRPIDVSAMPKVIEYYARTR